MNRYIEKAERRGYHSGALWMFKPSMIRVIILSIGADSWGLFSTPYRTRFNGYAMMPCTDENGRWYYTRRELPGRLKGARYIGPWNGTHEWQPEPK